jgi:hypothetical protein
VRDAVRFEFFVSVAQYIGCVCVCERERESYIAQFVYMELLFVLHKSHTFAQLNTSTINSWNVMNVGQQ